MGNAIGKIIDFIVEIFQKNYKRPKLWIGLLLFFFCIALLFPYIDSNFFYYSRMGKRINTLREVMELDQELINSNQAYINEYQSILQEMEQQRERSINSLMNQADNYFDNLVAMGTGQGNKVIKFLTGAFWCILVTVCVPFMNTFDKRSEKLIVFIALVVISSLVGWICSKIPIIINPWVNYIGIPVAQIILVIIIVTRSNKKKKNG